MARWAPARWPLRVQVAVAFLGATAMAMVLLGAFVQVRVAEALDERLRDSLEVDADRLTGLAAPSRAAAVESLPGEIYGQILSSSGKATASSPLVVGQMLDADTLVELLRDDDQAYAERTVRARDVDSDDNGSEDEEALLLMRRLDDGYLVIGASREDLDDAVAAVRRQLVVGGPIALIVAGLLGYVVAGAGLRPIERMRAQAATISDRTAGERLPLPLADDELRRLAETLNDMLERLDEGLRRQRHFVAAASHELRTPLTLMRTELDLALARPRSPEELEAALRSTRVEVRRLIDLAAELLDLATADGRGLVIEARPVDLVALAENVVERFLSVAGTRALRVTSSGPVTVSGDRGRLDRALFNLVDNALRHGSGDVSVDIKREASKSIIIVRDEGHDGTAEIQNGLGLAIVHEIVRAHGGSASVRRTGDGTTATVELPTSALGTLGA